MIILKIHIIRNSADETPQPTLKANLMQVTYGITEPVIVVPRVGFHAALFLYREDNTEERRT